MNTSAQSFERVNWKEIIKIYQVPDFPKAVGQILTSVVPYFGLMILMIPW